MERGEFLARQCVLGLVAVLCLAADPPKGEAPVVIWDVDAGDTALDYQVPRAVCPAEDTFRERTADLYGFDDPFVVNGKPAHTLVRVEVIGRQGGYRGVIVVIDPATQTELRRSSEAEQPTCDDLIWVLSHRMRMVISPKPPKTTTPATKEAARDPKKDEEIQRRLDALEEADEDQAKTNQELRTKIAALQKALDDEKKRKMDLTYALSVGAFLTANLTNNVGPGAWVGGELRTGPLSLGLELRTVFPSAIKAPPVNGRDPGFDYDLSQYVALLTPCGRYSYFFGCAVAGAGAQLSYDSNFPGGTKSGTNPLIQLGGRIGVEIPFGESVFAGRAWGEVLYATPPTKINYISPEATYTGARPDVSAFFGVGLIVKFGKEGT